MLYPRNADPQLSSELFLNPGSEYRGTPFWAWNCGLEEQELLWQLDVMKQMGLGGAHMHVRTGLATPYLSDEHMACVKACVEKCRKEGMLAWLYDEDRWPSGAAGGIVTKEEKYRSCHLLITTKPYSKNAVAIQNTDNSGQARRAETGYLLTCYDIVLDENQCLKRADKISEDAVAEGTKWYVYVEKAGPNPWFNNQAYVNTLMPEAMRRFIEVTYERYLEVVGEDFGGVVPAIFTDEPQFPRKGTLGFAAESRDVILPWDETVPETFFAAYGEDLLEHLPELLWELPDGQVSTVRYHYHDHIAERFAQAFADQCGAWCEAHGLMLTGHMMEEPTLLSQTAALGDAMRSYRSFQLPGIDMLCNRREFTTAKQAQSAARQYGRDGVLSELYGVTGWDFDFRGHKYQGDWQAALGVTVRVPHLTWVSMNGEAKRDYPASIGYQSPWWKDYAYVEDHFARVNTALTRGKPVVRIGVIHPVESYWLHWGPAEQTMSVREQLDDNFKNITDWLICGNMDFDFISESLLPGQCPKGGAPLQVGQMTYDTVIVPACETLRSTTLERLEAFSAAGGRLIFVGAAPKYENAVPSERGWALWESAVHADFTREAVLDAAAPARLVEIRDGSGKRTDNLLHQLRADGEDRWLFVAHSKEPYNKDVPVAQTVRITLEGIYQVTRYDTLTGQISPMEATCHNGKTLVQTVLYDLDSLLLRYTPGKQAVQLTQKQVAGNAKVLPVPALVDYVLDEPNVYLMDKAEFALDEEPYAPAQELLRADNLLRAKLGWPLRQKAVAQPWTVKEERAEHTVRLRFTVHSTVTLPQVKLALECAEQAQIRWNGTEVTAKPDGWYADKSIRTVPVGPVREGINTAEIVLPFGKRTDVEWCYLLGDFGVQVCGEHRELIPTRHKLGFGDVTCQGLAHYGGNITYQLPVESSGGKLAVTVPHYVGAAIRVSLDGQQGYIVYPPYRLELEDVPAGTHVLQLTLLGNRENGFGPVHKADDKDLWIGPGAWRTAGSAWTECYRLKKLGLTSPPILEEIE